MEHQSLPKTKAFLNFLFFSLIPLICKSTWIGTFVSHSALPLPFAFELVNKESCQFGLERPSKKPPDSMLLSGTPGLVINSF